MKKVRVSRQTVAFPAMVAATKVALAFESVDLDRPGLSVLDSVDWKVFGEERWVVLGPNGSGKTTLFELASGYLHPTRGTVDILGSRLGRVDVRVLRRRLGVVSSSLSKKIVPSVSASEVVISGRDGALEPWWGTYDASDRLRAESLLAEAGIAEVAARPFGALSEGERQRVLLARALMSGPELLLLDEPAAGLDMGARERLLSYLGGVAGDVASPTTVMVTHHVEEIPSGFTHALLLRGGTVMAAGPLEEVITGDALSETFEVRLQVTRSSSRWYATSV